MDVMSGFFIGLVLGFIACWAMSKQPPPSSGSGDCQIDRLHI